MKSNINENEKQSQSQNARIAAYLKAGNSITQKEAYHMFDCFRLGARIADIKELYGWKIESNRVLTDTGKRVASYRLAAE